MKRPPSREVTARSRGARLTAAIAASLALAGCGSSVASSRSASVAAAPVRAAATPASASDVLASNWTTYHADAEATGVQPTAIRLRPLRGAWTSPQLDGELYGEPLVANGRVYAATENDTVYALSARTGKILWHRHLATPIPAGDLPCGDISPVVGITGTPVIDLARQEIFVDADTLIKGPAASHGVEAQHRLFGLDLLTGKVRLSESALPAAGEDQLAQLQRPGLALDRGRVVIAYGQNTGDCPGPNGPGHGFVVSIPETGGALHFFQIGQGADRGAVWMGGSSPVIDPHGNVYVASADGYDLGPKQHYDDSDAVLELSPTMSLESIFYPKSWQMLSGDDLDLGTGDPALVDGLVFQVGKTDVGYLLRQGRLGGEEGEVTSRAVCSGNPDGGHAIAGSVVFIPCPNGVTAMRIKTRSPHFTQLWTAADGSGGAPIIAGGLLWTIATNGTVNGLDPKTGKQVISESYGGSANHFPTPTAADGLLLVPGADQVKAFQGPGGLPASPTR